ncbi:magnesium transporter [Andreprevotia lacus DSM 23236]|jgi:magnesium transporter|uniref:Magnesium transport protein CorA n=1 Tax=Andreprevotia lacus DSM 23236 TaxID=1121001 RepID=A0A1W1Y0P0_9NEIS|nr:magnesium/cobalt transporter CorA [Andreprevotia lacus]SMC29702.1 magnesium transporter [Andreprevotia lacus DSM 23236]
MAKRRKLLPARAPHARHTPRADKAGSQPGTLQYVGAKAPEQTYATLIEFGPSENDFVQTRFTSVDEGRDFRPRYETLWLNLHGLGDLDMLKFVGRRFGLHPLVLEDILNTEQRPKVEAYPGYFFVTARLVRLCDDGSLDSEQVSIVVRRGVVVTFQEQPTGTFDGIRESLKTGQSQIRKLGADYLVYALLDKLVDRYYTVLEQLGEQIENLEDAIYASPRPAHLNEIQELRRKLLYLKRNLWPMREVLNVLQRDEPDFFHDETQLYLRDVYDHTVQLIESTESLRDLISGLQDTYASLQSQRLNEQMRVLTVITTIFMPLTLIAGIYGMNFEHMPELHWHYGYYYALGLMGTITVLLGGYFWLRRWF